MPIRILIADDHGLLRAGLRALLNAEPDLEVVGEAADGDEAMRLARTLQPDIVLMDINMPGSGGIETTRRLKVLQPDVLVLILTMHEDKGLLQEAIRAGAAGYIIKRAVESELVNAIHAVSRGDLYVHPAAISHRFSFQGFGTRLRPTRQSNVWDTLTLCTPGPCISIPFNCWTCSCRLPVTSSVRCVYSSEDRLRPRHARSLD